MDLGRAELGVVEEERGLSGSLFLECHRRRLRGVSLGRHLKRLDLAAVTVLALAYQRKEPKAVFAHLEVPSRCEDLPEAEEVADLLLARLRADALHVNGARHVCCCCCGCGSCVDEFVGKASLRVEETLVVLSDLCVRGFCARG